MKVLVLLADGVEEMEAVIVMDTLRRAQWQVVSASVSGPVLEASRGVKLVADALLGDVEPAAFDVLVVPGGMGGVDCFRASAEVLSLMRMFIETDGKVLAAICAAPLALQEAGVLESRTYTSHPAVADQLTCGTRCDERVVVDGNLVSSQGPGTAFEFALKLVELLDAPELAAQLKAEMLVSA